MSSSDNFYNILEVPDTASIDEIKKSYRKLSMIYHPDRNKSPDATDKIRKINEAYETLGDATKKQEYDMMLKNPNPFAKMGMGMNMGQHTGGGINMEEMLANMFGFGGIPMHMNMNMGHGPDIFSAFGPNVRVFHNGQQVNISQMQKPTPIIINTNIPIDKILTGTTVPLNIDRWIMENGNKVFEQETIYVDIPKGMDEGELIILRDKGNSLRDDCKGDVKIVIKIDNNTDFRRSGLDLLYEKTINVKEALCGFSFELKYITGKVYTITNNSGNIINNGYSKIIPNMGFTRDNHTGNLIITFNIKFPDKISPEVIESLKLLDF